ncbi:CG31820 [Drosophila busckii]|uniref:CG31820 n=1 Tax=Drosophila busckii TaxID=30019 RepID=A0A0M4ESA0_DROBS|nr:CG31820 [Drosophila busckii]
MCLRKRFVCSGLWSCWPSLACDELSKLLLRPLPALRSLDMSAESMPLLRRMWLLWSVLLAH